MKSLKQRDLKDSQPIQLGTFAIRTSQPKTKKIAIELVCLPPLMDSTIAQQGV